MPDSSSPSGGKRTAGAFDIRCIIAALIGIYGIVLVLLGLFNATDTELKRADGMNVNLWAGLGMVVVAGLFAVWARTKHTIVPADVEGHEDKQDH
ncbi:MAG: hypothetical protein WKF76_07255 [Nocardioidaceae bacterium]